MPRKNKRGDRGSVEEETIRAKQSNMAESHEEDSSQGCKRTFSSRDKATPNQHTGNGR